MGFSGKSSAADVLLVTERFDHDGVIHGALFVTTLAFFLMPKLSPMHPAQVCPNWDLDRLWGTGLRSTKRHAPLRLASKVFMSNISTPSILPKISSRSRPVACSRSVGTVPGFAPGGRRSSSVLMSAVVDRWSAFVLSLLRPCHTIQVHVHIPNRGTLHYAPRKWKLQWVGIIVK